ncbi:MAG: selenide, water dikinase SelD [Hespellia sp.]|nr:selenide, water dikinase SelD [Hespellia sp.]
MGKERDVRLTQMTRTAGCAAKLGPDILSQVLGTIPKYHDDDLLVGFETSDDAAIYKVTDEIAMIQTLDFFTPVVDDPYTFGQIAATNALSDIYAMGGVPKVALNIVAFPNCLAPAILGEILRGGADKVREAGAVLVGGHSIQDEEPKYGLCVSGFVHPDRIFRNYGCKPGDVLILTKQLGVGLVNTAVKADMVSERSRKEVVQVMTSLNRKAKEVIEEYPITACTDVTGFGLIGHGAEMASASNVTFEIDVKAVACIQDALSYAEMGLVPSGAYRNRKHTEAHVDLGNTEERYVDLLHDPQTSGGLLFSVAPEHVDAILQDMQKKGVDTRVSVVGRVVDRQDVWLRLKA